MVTMRRLITVIVRLWVDVQADTPAWEGQVECVGSDDRCSIATPEDLLAFMANTMTHAALPSETEAPSRQELSSVP